MKRVFWFVFFVVMAISCLDEPDCFRQDVNLVGISFKKLFDKQADTVRITNIVAQGFTGTGLLKDSITTSLSLPLNYLKDQTSFRIEGLTIEDSITYTMTLGHQSQIQFVSEDCGERYIVSNLKLLESSHSGKDSIQLISNSITNPASNNIVIYRCPRTNIMRFSFRQLYMDTVRRGKLLTLVIETLYRNGSIVNNKKITGSSILLPLDLNNSMIQYDFKFADDTTKREVKLGYEIAKDKIIDWCGEQDVIHKIKIIDPANPVDRNFILSVTKDSIYDPPHTNIEAYRCPTTNNIRVQFRQTRGGFPVTDTLNLLKLTAEYLSPESLAINRTTPNTSVILPLDPNATSTKFTFTIKDDKDNVSEKNLVIGYAVIFTKFNDKCGSQPVFSNLNVIQSDFNPSAIIDIVDPKVKFPVVTNITFENAQ